MRRGSPAIPQAQTGQSGESECARQVDERGSLGRFTRTLNRLARQNAGVSAKELICERIVLEANRLLTHTPGSVAEAAEQLGFDEPSDFSA
ncbi:helix-turn-helix domain-containing protein [Nocardia pseudovaccinii]|uniref:helix-turn-helix domain-containing protein n=1 Tax=Nocardia pseudovaccinii TaxID=189540 RepID=UPI0007A4142D|nr:helix-turn-helix domain-containing protein [Nocardia pseudovaccinii]